jgi:hypothetical protein
VHYPELQLCTDNGAMIALAAAMRLQAGLAQATLTTTASTCGRAGRFPRPDVPLVLVDLSCRPALAGRPKMQAVSTGFGLV